MEEAAARDAVEKAAAKRAVAERAAAHSTAQEKAAAQEMVAAAERAAQEKADTAEELKRHNPTRVATGIVCARCEHDKPGGCFSQRQHKKPREDRVCFGCTQVLWCSGCFGTRHREEFSQRQLRKGPGKQKCRKCMAILVDQEARELAWKEKKKRETAKLVEQCVAREKRVGKDPAVYAPSVSSSNPWMPLSEASGESAEASIYSDLLERKQTPIAVLQGLIRGYAARLVVKQALDEQGRNVLLPRVLWLQRRRRQVTVDRKACAAARVELALRKQQHQILVAEAEEEKIEALREETERSLAAREEAEEEAEVAAHEAEAQQHIADGEVECMAHIFLSGTCPCPKCEREREEEAKREAEEEAEREAEEEAERARFNDESYDQDREVVVMLKPTFDSYSYQRPGAPHRARALHEGYFEAGDKGTTFWMPDEEGYFRVKNMDGDVGYIHKDDLCLVTENEDESNEDDDNDDDDNDDDDDDDDHDDHDDHDHDHDRNDDDNDDSDDDDDTKRKKLQPTRVCGGRGAGRRRQLQDDDDDDDYNDWSGDDWIGLDHPFYVVPREGGIVYCKGEAIEVLAGETLVANGPPADDGDLIVWRESDRAMFWIHKSHVQKGSTWRDPECVDAETRDLLQRLTIRKIMRHGLCVMDQGTFGRGIGVSI